MPETPNIVVLPGDGIGPEIVAAARQVLDLLGEFNYDERLMGGCSIDANGVRGSLIFTNASAALKGFPASGAFAMACQAKAGLAESLARELAEALDAMRAPLG